MTGEMTDARGNPPPRCPVHHIRVNTDPKRPFSESGCWLCDKEQRQADEGWATDHAAYRADHKADRSDER